MKKAIAALVILATAAGPAMAKGHEGHGRPRHYRGPNPALCFPYGDTAVAAATAFSIIFDSIKGNDRYYPVPVPQPVAVPVAQPVTVAQPVPVPVPVYPPQPVYYPPYPPLAYNAPVGWVPAPYYPMQ